MLVEQLVAASVIIVVGGAILGVLYKVAFSQSKEDKELLRLRDEFKTDKGKGKGTTKGKGKGKKG